MKNIIKETKKEKGIDDIDIFYKTEKLIDVNGQEFTIKKEISNVSEKHLLIEKEQAESVIAEFTEKLNEINELLSLIKKITIWLKKRKTRTPRRL